jgi:hypothetical protein
VASSRFNRLVSLRLRMSSHKLTTIVHRTLLLSVSASSSLSDLMLPPPWRQPDSIRSTETGLAGMRESPAAAVLADSALLRLQSNMRESYADVLELDTVVAALGRRGVAGRCGNDCCRRRIWPCALAQAISTFVRSRRRLPIADPRVDRSPLSPSQPRRTPGPG